MSSRCWGCCQENCGYGSCTCSCHEQKPAYDPFGDPYPLPIPVTIEQRVKTLNRIQLDHDLAVLEAFMGVSKCKKHPKYEAKRKPRTACEACWRKWIALHP